MTRLENEYDAVSTSIESESTGSGGCATSVSAGAAAPALGWE